MPKIEHMVFLLKMRQIKTARWLGGPSNAN
jgi:hypothetical protein